MNWKDALTRSNTHTDYAIAELDLGLHVDFTANDLQKLVDAVATAERGRLAEKFNGVYACCCDADYTGGDLAKQIKSA